MKRLKHVKVKTLPIVYVVDTVLEIPEVLKTLDDGNNYLIKVDGDDIYFYVEGEDYDGGYYFGNYKEYFSDNKIYCVSVPSDIIQNTNVVDYSNIILNQREFDLMFVKPEPKQIRKTTAQMVFEYVLKESVYRINHMKNNVLYMNYGKSECRDYVIGIHETRTNGNTIFLFDQETYDNKFFGKKSLMDGDELQFMLLADSVCRIDTEPFMTCVKERNFNCFEEIY